MRWIIPRLACALAVLGCGSAGASRIDAAPTAARAARTATDREAAPQDAEAPGDERPGGDVTAAESDDTAAREARPAARPRPEAPARVAEARSRPSPPFAYYVTARNASVMWADLKRLRAAAGGEVADQAADSLRAWQADLGVYLAQPGLGPDHVERLVMASPGWRGQYVATLVYAAAVQARLAALYPEAAPLTLADGRVVSVHSLGPDLRAAAVGPSVVVLGTARELQEALRRPPRTTAPELAAPGQIFDWTLEDARRYLATRPRRVNPDRLRMQLSLGEDGLYAVEARGVFAQATQAADAETHWRGLLAALGDNALFRALGLERAFGAARVSRPANDSLRITMILGRAELANLARLFATGEPL